MKPKHMKILGKMIQSEDEGTDCRELNETELAHLLDEGFIEEHRWSEKIPHGIMDCSDYVVTDAGRDAYFQWQTETVR